MKKKIIFFDGDGTLWYPKKTKHSKRPVWLYLDKRHKNHTDHLMLIPTVIQTLKKLRKEGIITVILSTHPQLPKEADAILNHKVRHFKLDDLFDEIYATKLYEASKGEFIERILKERKIPKSKALMVGDSYKWDYVPAINAGIDALLIESNYELHQKHAKKTIKKLSEILDHI